MPHWSDALRKCEANAEMIWWAATQPDADTAWRVCTRGDWMLRLLGRKLYRRKTPKHRALVAICCECARISLPHVRPGEMRPLRAIEAAERYARGEAISRAELRRAADDAYAADYASCAYAVKAADSAADYAAYAAASAANAADYVGYAGYAAVNAANAVYTGYAAANAATYAAARAQCATIVRRHHQENPL